MTNTKTHNKTLKIALDWEVDIIDPPASFGGWNTGRVVQQTHEGLIEDDLNSAGNKYTVLVPALAENYEISNDCLTYTFHLRRNVLFHDGSLFNAEAVKINLERMWDKTSKYYYTIAADYNKVVCDKIKNIRIIDDYTISIDLFEPFPEFLRYMTQEDSPGSFVFISPESLIKYGTSGVADRAPGTGPFFFKERFNTKNGSGVILQRNENYWGNIPDLYSIEFIPYPDSEERANALMRGEVDLVYSPEPKQIEELEEKGFNITSKDVPYVWYFAFNLNEPPYNDSRVRKAIAHGIDCENLVNKLFGKAAKAANGIIPPACPSYQNDVSNYYPYDQDLAKKLLHEAGVSSGELIFRLQVAKAGSGQLDPIKLCAEIEKYLSNIDIAVEIEVNDDWVEYCEEWHKGIPKGVAASEMSWGMSCDVWLEQILHSRYISPVGFNTGYYSNKNVDILLDLARTELDDDRRTNLYQVAHRLIMDDLPVLPILNLDKGLVAYSKRVEGFVDAPQNWHDFKNISLVQS